MKKLFILHLLSILLTQDVSAVTIDLIKPEDTKALTVGIISGALTGGICAITEKFVPFRFASRFVLWPASYQARHFMINKAFGVKDSLLYSIIKNRGFSHTVREQIVSSVAGDVTAWITWIVVSFLL